MKKIACLLVLGLGLSKVNAQTIPHCFVDFDGRSAGLKVDAVDRLPDGADKFRMLATDAGEKEVSRVEGYRILYKNKKKAPFVNLKVERSDGKSYGQDTLTILDNFRYMAAHGKNMESTDLIVLKYNGYAIYGISRNSLDEGSTLGSFVTFAGDGLVVYFYFNNLPPQDRSFGTVDEYRSQRNAFLGSYTAFVNGCRAK